MGFIAAYTPTRGSEGGAIAFLGAGGVRASEGAFLQHFLYQDYYNPEVVK